MYHPRNRSPQPVLILQHRRLQRAGRALLPLDQKPPDLPRALQLCPHQHELRNRGIGNPRLAATQLVHPLFPRTVPRRGFHTPRIAPVVRFRQPETAQHLPLGEPGQEPIFLLPGAEFVDAAHDEGGLHGHAGAIARVHALDFTGDEPGGDGGDAGAGVGFYGGAEEAEGAHFGEDGRVVVLVSVGVWGGVSEVVVRFALWGGKSGGARRRRRGGDLPRTRGSIRSWQYDRAVSWIANSSSVNREAESRGSSQLNGTGAWTWRLAIVRCIAAPRGCLLNTLLIMMGVSTTTKLTKERKGTRSIERGRMFSVLLSRMFCFPTLSQLPRLWRHRYVPGMGNRGFEVEHYCISRGVPIYGIVTRSVCLFMYVSWP